MFFLLQQSAILLYFQKIYLQIEFLQMALPKLQYS